MDIMTLYSIKRAYEFLLNMLVGLLKQGMLYISGAFIMEKAMLYIKLTIDLVHVG